MASSRIHLQPGIPSHFSAAWHPHQWNWSQPAYQRDLKEGNDKSLEELTPKEISEVLYTEEDVDRDHYYSNELNDEWFISFVGIKSVCTYCSKTFTSKILLHKLLKSCIIRQQISPSTDISASAIKPVIESLALPMSLGTGFGFRG